MKLFGSCGLLTWLAIFSKVSTVVSQADIETAAPTAALFTDCDPDVYYAPLLQDNPDPTTWTSEALMSLVKDTHKNILPTHGDKTEDDDIYKAIIDLDPGNTSNTVWLVYRDMEAGELPNANPLYWDAERLYPMDRGYDTFSPAYTDVHNLRPAKSTVLMVKGNLSFGMCDTVEYPDVCVTPATVETANDTAQDGKIWTPPERFRGEIARALLYVDLRYEHLSLQDCGPFTNAMGYLSQMLEWHEMYPVTERELRRNNQACARWQGNRNPFVDFPELTQALHGTPEQILEGTRTYPTCIENFPTQAPTATRNDCGMVRRGDLPFFLVNTLDPDEVVFLPLTDLPGNMELYLTDKAWNGTDLLDGVANEGTLVVRTVALCVCVGVGV
jgi:Endonuclease I